MKDEKGIGWSKSKIKKCDSCGKEFVGKSYPVKDTDTFEIQEGLIQCKECWEG